MTVDQLLATLEGRRISLFLNGAALNYRAPAGAVTAELREAISHHRQKIIARLRARRNGGNNRMPKCIHVNPWDWIDEPPTNGRIRTTCRRCGRFIGYRPSGNCRKK